MALLGRDMFMLFPTGLFTGMVPDITMCDRIEKKLREMQRPVTASPPRPFCARS